MKQMMQKVSQIRSGLMFVLVLCLGLIVTESEAALQIESSPVEMSPRSAMPMVKAPQQSKLVAPSKLELQATVLLDLIKELQAKNIENPLMHIKQALFNPSSPDRKVAQVGREFYTELMMAALKYVEDRSSAQAANSIRFLREFLTSRVVGQHVPAELREKIAGGVLVSQKSWNLVLDERNNIKSINSDRFLRFIGSLKLMVLSHNRVGVKEVLSADQLSLFEQLVDGVLAETVNKRAAMMPTDLVVPQIQVNAPTVATIAEESEEDKEEDDDDDEDEFEVEEAKPAAQQPQVVIQQEQVGAFERTVRIAGSVAAVGLVAALAYAYFNKDTFKADVIKAVLEKGGNEGSMKDMLADSDKFDKFTKSAKWKELGWANQNRMRLAHGVVSMEQFFGGKKLSSDDIASSLATDSTTATDWDAKIRELEKREENRKKEIEYLNRIVDSPHSTKSEKQKAHRDLAEIEKGNDSLSLEVSQAARKALKALEQRRMQLWAQATDESARKELKQIEEDIKDLRRAVDGRYGWKTTFGAAARSRSNKLSRLAQALNAYNESGYIDPSLTEGSTQFIAANGCGLLLSKDENAAWKGNNKTPEEVVAEIFNQDDFEDLVNRGVAGKLDAQINARTREAEAALKAFAFPQPRLKRAVLTCANVWKKRIQQDVDKKLKEQKDKEDEAAKKARDAKAAQDAQEKKRQDKLNQVAGRLFEAQNKALSAIKTEAGQEIHRDALKTAQLLKFDELIALPDGPAKSFFEEFTDLVYSDINDLGAMSTSDQEKLVTEFKSVLGSVLKRLRQTKK